MIFLRKFSLQFGWWSVWDYVQFWSKNSKCTVGQSGLVIRSLCIRGTCLLGFSYPWATIDVFHLCLAVSLGWHYGFDVRLNLIPSYDERQLYLLLKINLTNFYCNGFFTFLYFVKLLKKGYYSFFNKRDISL